MWFTNKIIDIHLAIQYTAMLLLQSYFFHWWLLLVLQLITVDFLASHQFFNKQLYLSHHPLPDMGQFIETLSRNGVPQFLGLTLMLPAPHTVEATAI